MSLFGSEEPSPALASRPRNTLFDDDDRSAPGSKSSLFADEDSPGSSPWDNPTPKKAARSDLIKNLLPASNVPDFYINTFDNVLDGGDGAGGKINAAGVTRTLSAAKLSADDTTGILGIISSGGPVTDLSRNEFNVLLALIGLAQEHEDVTLDGVDERRRNLPSPDLSGLSNTRTTLQDTSILAAKPPQRPMTPPPTAELTQKPRMMQKDSITFPENDPWASPDPHRGHNHTVTTPRTSGVSRESSFNGNTAPVRTTSVFTTQSTMASNGTSGSESTDETQSGPVTGVWGCYEAPSSSSYNSQPSATIEGGGFGDSGGGGGERTAQNLPVGSFVGTGRVPGQPNGETVVVTLLPEKEGIFMFQHHNYQVTSVRKGAKVVRRYSDFVWLLDCLQKRFPFRQLPLLPPKRVGVNGSHLAADSTFIEKRRRGLTRFANALVRHPVLSQEQLVIMFLTVPTELAVWRKQATISVQEEFNGKALPAGLEDSLPSTLQDLFDTTRQGVRRSADIYINLCNLMDRLSKRTEGLAADHLRIALSLQTLADASHDTYASDANDVPLLNEGLNATAKHMSNSQSLLEDEARAWDLGVLEDLKRQRDALVSVRDMFDRRDRYDKDNISYLERRIQSNETKLANIRAKPDDTVRPGEIDKVIDAMIKDKESIVSQHARGVFIKECIRDELLYFQDSQYHVSRLSQDYAQERVKYSELQADNWKQLQEELESMPVE
ncbi:sorting nexin-like protein mvp1 [Calycina marina]|uniref:Sorting nexin MVP1 n=1 Tax=Calycina marina TaxID=1763456 RepID=A0A9P7ZCI9_9HELO|nr:sorting nexin-like protein mvp1 [Calycina marina]